ncbi:MAG: hypothetical protein ACLU0O_11305 [Collinsella sp.]
MRSLRPGVAAPELIAAAHGRTYAQMEAAGEPRLPWLPTCLPWRRWCFACWVTASILLRCR